jgi:hypothetical protein
MAGAAHEVAATLNALEGKLRELERELLRGGNGEPAAAHAPAPAHQEVVPGAAPAAAPAPDEDDALDELVAFRDLLERSAETLIAEYGRLLDRLRGDPLATGRPPEQTFEGHVLIEATPFPDVATLFAFERAVLQVTAVREARVSSYDGCGATVHVLLGEPSPLASELRRVSPLGFTVTDSRPGAITLELSSGP